MPVNLHGKSYNTVAERINSAGKELIGVSTEVLFTDPVVIKATIITRLLLIFLLIVRRKSTHAVS